MNAVETKINIPERLCLRSLDLNVLLGNLLDNAIDASLQTEKANLGKRQKKVTYIMNHGKLKVSESAMFSPMRIYLSACFSFLSIRFRYNIV